MGTNESDFQQQSGQTSGGTTVKGKRVKFQHLDATTVSVFFTSFPVNAKNSDLRSLFARFGQVEEVFVPKKLHKWGRKFGFVKYKEVGNEEDLEGRLEEVLIWNHKLKVNQARFGREKQQEKEVKQAKVANSSGGAVIVPGKSFKNALKG